MRNALRGRFMRSLFWQGGADGSVWRARHVVELSYSSRLDLARSPRRRAQSPRLVTEVGHRAQPQLLARPGALATSSSSATALGSTWRARHVVELSHNSRLDLARSPRSPRRRAQSLVLWVPPRRAQSLLSAQSLGSLWSRVNHWWACSPYLGGLCVVLCEVL